MGLNLSRALIRSGAFDRIELLAPAGHGYEELAGPAVRVHTLPPRHRFLRAIATVRALCRRNRNAVLLNLCNIGIPVATRQWLLVHRPHHIYPYADAMAQLSPRQRLAHHVKDALFLLGLRWTSQVLVQTDYAKARFEECFGRHAEIIPNALPQFGDATTAALIENDGRTAVLSLTRYYPHKNLERIADMIERLGDRLHRYRFIFTLDGKAGRSEAALLGRLAPHIAVGHVVNLGRVDHGDLPALFRSAQILLMPTLLESFSTTYVEAMEFGVPIVTTDRGFARAVCGEAALYADPHDSDALISALERLRTDSELVAGLLGAGRSRLAAMSDWDSCAHHLVELGMAHREGGFRAKGVEAALAQGERRPS